MQTVYNIEMNNSMSKTNGRGEDSLYYFVPGAVIGSFKPVSHLFLEEVWRHQVMRVQTVDVSV